MSVAVLSFVFERIQLLQLNRRVRTHRIGRHSVTDYGHDFFLCLQYQLLQRALLALSE